MARKERINSLLRNYHKLRVCELYTTNTTTCSNSLAFSLTLTQLEFLSLHSLLLIRFAISLLLLLLLPYHKKQQFVYMRHSVIVCGIVAAALLFHGDERIEQPPPQP